MNMHQYKQIQQDLNAELREVFKKYNLRAHTINTKVSEIKGEVTFKIEAKDQQPQQPLGADDRPEVIYWNMWHDRYNLPKDALNKIFRFRDKLYRIIGLKDTRAKGNVLAIGIHNGTIYRFTPEDVIAALK